MTQAVRRTNPFILTEHDNKLYGLGIADMKGLFALYSECGSRDINAAKLMNVVAL